MSTDPDDWSTRLLKDAQGDAYDEAVHKSDRTERPLICSRGLDCRGHVLRQFSGNDEEVCAVQGCEVAESFARKHHVYPAATWRRIQTMTHKTIAEHEAASFNHVYKDAPDARQSDDIAMPTSRFRPKYRALTADEKALHDAIKSKASELEALFETVKAGRYRSLGLTDLESAVMWVVKELTA